MILSASVNADVPAHYGEWFRRRLDAGYLRIVGSDPWKQRRIELDSNNIDGIVFWTRNVASFVPVLDELRARRIAFIVHYAFTGDAASRSSKAAIAAIRELAARYRQRSVVWRYDPVVLDARRSVAAHSVIFSGLALSLAGIVDEVVIAFARKALRQRRASSATGALDQHLLTPAERSGAPSNPRRELVRQLAGVAANYAMRLSVCSDADALAPGASPARCIDARRIADIAGRPLDAPTAGFMRDCLCARALDIGDHGGSEPTCFCGASPGRRARLRHDPESEFLFEPVDRFRSVRSADLPF